MTVTGWANGGANGGVRPAVVRTQGPGSTRAGGVSVVWRSEMTKLIGQLRVRVAVGLCLLGPLVVVAAFGAQQATPTDTLFGQWVGTSGWATPLVVLAWASQWLLPALTAVVAGDIFSAEDHLGTWKTLLTRSRSRGEIFAGKVLAALTYSVAMVVTLTASAVASGLVGNGAPLVALSGQTVPGSRAAALVAISWSTQILPAIGYAGLAMAASVISRSSVVGIGAPVALALILQIVSLVNLPLDLRVWLITTPSSDWLGLWTQPSSVGPVAQGALTSAVWAAVSITAAWVLFRHRDIATS